MKKLNQKGIIHHLALIILAVVVAGALAFTGYKVYQAEYGVNAKAKGYTIIASWANGAYLKACKVAVGSQWRINFTAYNPYGTVSNKYSNDKVSFGFYVERGKVLANTYEFGPFSPGSGVSKTGYANISTVMPDTYSTSVGNGKAGGGGPYSSSKSFSTITGC